MARLHSSTAALRLSCAAALLSAATHAQAPPISKPLTAGDPLPALAFRCTNGQTVSTNTLNGKVVALFFWTSDGPCKAAMTSRLRPLAEEYTDDLVIIAAHIQGLDANAMDARTRSRATWLEAKNGPAIAKKLGVRAGPQVLVVGRDGKVTLPPTHAMMGQVASVVAKAVAEPEDPNDGRTSQPTEASEASAEQEASSASTSTPTGERSTNTAPARRDHRPEHFADREYVNRLVDQYIALRRRAPTSIEAARARTKVDYYMQFVRLEIAHRDASRRVNARRLELRELTDAGRVSLVPAQMDKVREAEGELAKIELAQQGVISLRLQPQTQSDHVYRWSKGSGWQLEKLDRVRPRHPLADFMLFGETAPGPSVRLDTRHHEAIQILQRRAGESQEWHELSRALGAVHILILEGNKDVERFATYWHAIWQWVLCWGDETTPTAPPTLETMRAVLASGPTEATATKPASPARAPVEPELGIRPIRIPDSVDIGAFRRQLARTNKRKPGKSRLEQHRRRLQGSFCASFEVNRATASFHKVFDNMAGPFRVFWADLRDGADAEPAVRLAATAAAMLIKLSGTKSVTAPERAAAGRVLEGLGRLEKLIADERWDDAEQVLKSGRTWILRGSPFPLH